MTLTHGAGGPAPVGGQLNPNALGACVTVWGSPTPGQGDQEVTFTAQVNGGSNLLEPVNSLSGLYVGQLVAQNGPWDGGFWIPNACEIVALGSGPPLWVEISGQGIQTTLSVPMIATDWLPTGYLTVTVTPGSGVQMIDWNADQSSPPNVDTQGNAQMIQNYGGQADGGFFVSFANAGSYSVSVAFTSQDSNYSGATIQYPLAVTVT